MWRYYGLSFVIAILAIAVAGALDHLGVFAAPTATLIAWLGQEGLVEVREFQAIVAILLALFMGWAVVDIPRLPKSFSVWAAASILTLTLVPTLALYGILFEPFTGLSALGAAYLLGLAFAATAAGRRKRRVGRMLGHRVARPGLALALRQNSAANVPVRDEISVVTCRILNVGELAAALKPSEVLAIQEHFFTASRKLLFDAGAVLDLSAPDCLRGYFGCFEEIPGGAAHASAACAAVVELRASVRKMAVECEDRWGEEVRFGLSVASGHAVLSAFGDPKHPTFSALGEAVDFGRRLAGANARYGSRALVAARTYQLAKDKIEVRPMEMLFDPSANTLVEVYEILGNAGDLSPEAASRRDAFWEGVVLLRCEKWAAAAKRFEAAMTDELADYPLDFFLAQARKGGSASSSKAVRGRGKHARSVDSL
ncbi:hypothetical protein BH23VER1_BH23VER1_30770 [soil metagenome]